MSLLDSSPDQAAEDSPLKVVQAEPATGAGSDEETGVGSLFVSNYPPFSFWDERQLGAVEEALDRPPRHGVDFGLYLHIPFCRKRCKFCYFRVYTDKNSDEVGGYLEALASEVESYAGRAAFADRLPKFIYFGGGTPSFIAVKQLLPLVERLKAAMPWEEAEEVTFECEPGTLNQAKLEALKEIGVTRLSLGVEHFDDTILEENGRAHTSKEIYRVLPWIAEIGFDQLNIDLIAGMVGETWETWRGAVDETLKVMPESVTVYQMELPYNTRYAQQAQAGKLGVPLADWQTKREWNAYAIERLAEAGYVQSSAYTMVRGDRECRFVYRDAVWRGWDMLGTGVASFSHLSGVHFQNVDGWGDYMAHLTEGELPLGRAYETGADDRLTRELILQLKLGRIGSGYFRDKFGVDIFDRFGDTFRQLEEDGMLKFGTTGVRLTRQGLLCVDSLLPSFYHSRYRNARYT